MLTTANSTNGIKGTGFFDFTDEFVAVTNPNSEYFPATVS